MHAKLRLHNKVALALQQVNKKNRAHFYYTSLRNSKILSLMNFFLPTRSRKVLIEKTFFQITLSARPLFTSGYCDKRKHHHAPATPGTNKPTRQSHRSHKQASQIPKQYTANKGQKCSKNGARAPSVVAGVTRCPCAAASSRLHSAEQARPISRRKICVVASSFLDFEGTSDDRKYRKFAASGLNRHSEIGEFVVPLQPRCLFGYEWRLILDDNSMREGFLRLAFGS